MLLVVICRWCDVDVCRDPGNVSTSIIAQHTVLRVVKCWDCGSVILNSRVVAFARQREITGEPLNSRSRILAPNKREITGVDCTKSMDLVWWTDIAWIMENEQNRHSLNHCSLVMPYSDRDLGHNMVWGSGLVPNVTKPLPWPPGQAKDWVLVVLRRKLCLWWWHYEDFVLYVVI